MVEKIGVDKAKAKLSCAALALCVFDASQPLSDEDLELLNDIGEIPAIAILNKADLIRVIKEEELKERFDAVLYLSAKHDEGTRELIESIKRLCIGAQLSSDDALIYNERQRGLTKKARDSIKEALSSLSSGMTNDAVTVSIEEAVAALCELTGERVTDEVVDQVFHTFCVGK